MLMSLGLSRVIPLSLSSTLLPVWSCSRIDLPSSLITRVLLAGVTRVMIFFSSSNSTLSWLLVTIALV